jgi:hypothetical protein
VARVTLGLTTEEFLRLTPRQFAALQDVAVEREEAMDARFAVLSCLIANAHRGKRRKPFRVQDFMPQRRKAEAKAQTWQEQLAIVKQWHLLFGGKEAPRGQTG